MRLGPAPVFTGAPLAVRFPVVGSIIKTAIVPAASSETNRKRPCGSLTATSGEVVEVANGLDPSVVNAPLARVMAYAKICPPPVGAIVGTYKYFLFTIQKFWGEGGPIRKSNRSLTNHVGKRGSFQPRHIDDRAAAEIVQEIG